MKLDTFTRASWYMANGMPPAWVAERLGISRTTLWSWRQMMDHDHAFKALRRRVLLLPEWQRDQLVTDLTGARRATR